MASIEHFKKVTRLDHPATEVFNWHKRPGAFERLQPYWIQVQVLKRKGEGIQNGTQLTLAIKSGWLTSTQVVEHKDYVEGKQFKDFQVQGPYEYFEHTHRVNELGPQQAEMEDSIEYALPHWISIFRSKANAYTQKEFKRYFNYRHAVLKHDLDCHQGVAPMKILVTGSSGFVGSALVPFLTTGGHQVLKLVRTRSNLGPNETGWNLERGVINPDDLEGLDAVIHLAGENINGKWNNEKKQRILDSRVKGTRLLCHTLANLKKPPKVLISASAVGYYGNRGAEILTEQSPQGRGFLADVCQEWEEATQEASAKGIRVVNMRFGIVLGPNGGALKEMLTPFKLFLGGKLGSGDQYMSWIAIDDLLGAILFSIRNPILKGPVNAVSPNPVTNKEFTKTLGHVLNRPTFLSMPDFLTRRVFGEVADEMLLTSERVEPKALKEAGFKFTYPHLEQALQFLLGQSLE